MPVSDDEFETMRARARSYRNRLDELGSVSGPVIEENVRERLRSTPTSVSLPPAQGELADEIVAFLEHPQLTAHQSALLELELLGG